MKKFSTYFKGVLKFSLTGIIDVVVFSSICVFETGGGRGRIAYEGKENSWGKAHATHMHKYIALYVQCVKTVKTDTSKEGSGIKRKKK